MLTDSTSLVLALIAASLATRAATVKRTFGLQRAEVLAALGNALLLVAIGVWVLSRPSIGCATRSRSKPPDAGDSGRRRAGQHGRTAVAPPRRPRA